VKRIVIFIGLIFTIALSVSAQVDLQPAATVNLTKSEVITVKQLRTAVEQFEKGLGKTLSVQERLEVLNNMINEKLVQQAAERDKIYVTENEIDQQIAQLRNQLSQNLGRAATDAEFAQAIKSEYNLDMTAFRTELRKMLTSQKYLMAKKEKQMQTEAAALKDPTEAEISKFLADNQGRFSRPETVELSVIQVPFESNRAKAKETIDNMAKKIGTNSEEFNRTMPGGILAGSSYRSGRFYLPRDDQGRGAFGNEFVDTAFSLRTGEISRVITGLDGFYIIRAETKYQPAFLGLNDPVQLGTPNTVREYIVAVLKQQSQQRILTKATEELVKDLRTGKTFQIYDNNLKW